MNWIDRWIVRPRPWRTALLLGSVALLPRLAWVLVAGPGYEITPDSDAYTYDRFARLMLSGWDWITTPLARREPLYPVLMALAHRMPGESAVRSLQLIQAFLGTGTVLLLYSGLVRHVRPGVAFLSALLVALNPHFIYYTILGYRENLTVFLLAALLVALTRLVCDDSPRPHLVMALILVLLIHNDVRFLPLSLTLPGLLLVAQGWDWRPALRKSAWVFLVLLLLMVPYQVRGYLAMGRPVIVTDKFLGQWLPLVSTRWQTDPPESPKEGARQRWLGEWEADKLARFDELRPDEQRLFRSGARPTLSRLGTYRFHFADYWRFFKLHDSYRPYPDGRFNPAWSLLHNASSLIAMVPFFLLAPFAFAWRRTPPGERWWVLSLALLLTAHMVMHVAVHSLERYRIPMEIVTATLTAVGLVNLTSFVFSRRLATPAVGARADTRPVRGVGGAARSRSG